MTRAEEWRPVDGYPRYQISSLGRVLSTAPFRGSTSPRILRHRYTTDGYPTVGIGRAGEPTRTRYVHHLILEAFVGPRPDGMEVRHLDGNPANCNLSNLRYGTASENGYDRVRHGTHPGAAKTHCPSGHPYDEQNTRYGGPKGRTRWCRACHYAASKRYYERQRGVA